MVIKNFLFHRVSNDEDNLWPPMRPLLFDRVIQFLKANYDLVPLEQFLHDPKAFGKIKKPATVLFDDGYKDNIEFAAPILQSYKCPASFYVVTDCIDRDLPTWTYLIDNALQKTKQEKIELNLSFVPAGIRVIKIIKEIGSDNIGQVKPWMKSLPNAQRMQILREILAQCSDVEIPSKKMMNWKDVCQLHSEGFIIGSHSHTHPMLASLADEAEIKEELSVSFKKIQQETGNKPLSISYPIGSFDERVKQESERCGYQFGLAVEQRFYKNFPLDKYEIPRVELYQEAWWKTKMRISGIYGSMRRLWK
jgi:peptidoglycan/xylan/chitin deacetylase (PgdA/CDA1 family)